jgi:RNA 3'-terminal phosphate cyclase (ATP)
MTKSIPIAIDGSWGEGGGQILRTSLSLAAITGQSFQLYNIRAGRKNPGLAAQHLTSAWAAAAVCQAKLNGDALGSMFLEFIPQASPQAGNYSFDVTEARTGGSAGAITLILQTILLPLALAEGNSTVILKGGTHVAWSPTVTYIDQVYLPFLHSLGIQAQVTLKQWGWYPIGGGEVILQVTGGSHLKSLQLQTRGDLQQVTGLAIATELPSHIAQRMANRAENLLTQAHLKAQIQPRREKALSPGAGIFLLAEYAHSRAGFSALGKRGLPAEQVAQLACEELLAFHQTEAPIDPYLGDQLLLPLSLAPEASLYRVAEITEHLRTNAWVLEQFGIAQVQIEEEGNLVSISPIDGRLK